jgi:hypothetical protein
LRVNGGEGEGGREREEERGRLAQGGTEREAIESTDLKNGATEPTK